VVIPQTIAGNNKALRLEPPITMDMAVALRCGIHAFTAAIDGTNPPIENPKEITKYVT
jgi:hypothetical protein